MFALKPDARSLSVATQDDDVVPRGEASSHAAASHDPDDWTEVRSRQRRREHSRLHATSSTARSGLRSVHTARAGNAGVVDAFTRGLRERSDVLKVTSKCIAACGGNTAAAQACFQELQRAVRHDGRVAPDVWIYGALISSHEKAGDAAGAVRWFKDMLARGIAPNVVTYSALISAHEKAGEVDGAVQWFEDMLARQVAPNVVTYSVLISAHDKAGDAAGAARWYENMLARGIAPDAVTYTALMTAHLRVGKEDAAVDI
jgi:pentatricopeptide repeat protein